MCCYFPQHNESSAFFFLKGIPMKWWKFSYIKFSTGLLLIKWVTCCNMYFPLLFICRGGDNSKRNLMQYGLEGVLRHFLNQTSRPNTISWAYDMPENHQYRRGYSFWRQILALLHCLATLIWTHACRCVFILFVGSKLWNLCPLFKPFKRCWCTCLSFVEEGGINVLLQTLVGRHVVKLPLTTFHQGNSCSKVEMLVSWATCDMWPGKLSFNWYEAFAPINTPNVIFQNSCIGKYLRL